MQTLTASCTDTAGNTGSSEYVVRVDRGAPVAAPVLDPVPPSGWYTSDVDVRWGWSDTVSGIDPERCTTTSTSSVEGLVSLRASCVDRAGNTGSGGVSFSVDRTAPVLRPTVSPAPLLFGGPATASAGAADSLSGVAYSACGTPSTSVLGRGTVTCRATDVAGNAAEAAAGYVVGVGIRWAPLPAPVKPDAGRPFVDVAVQLTGADGKAVPAEVVRALATCSVSFQVDTEVPVCAGYVSKTATFTARVPITRPLTGVTSVRLQAVVTKDGVRLGSGEVPVPVLRR